MQNSVARWIDGVCLIPDVSSVKELLAMLDDAGTTLSQVEVVVALGSMAAYSGKRYWLTLEESPIVHTREPVARSWDLCIYREPYGPSVVLEWADYDQEEDRYCVVDACVLDDARSA